MKAALLASLFAANATTVLCAAEGGSYSEQFQRACGDKPVPFQVTSGSLVDTNNSSPSVRASSLSLSLGAIGGVRPGMSMDEVIALWGKPVSIGCCATGRPSFSYYDVWVRFGDKGAEEIGLLASQPWTPRFHLGLCPYRVRTNGYGFSASPRVSTPTTLSPIFITRRTIRD
jgi:hypothetical protein